MKFHSEIEDIQIELNDIISELIDAEFQDQIIAQTERISVVVDDLSKMLKANNSAEAGSEANAMKELLIRGH